MTVSLVKVQVLFELPFFFDLQTPTPFSGHDRCSTVMSRPTHCVRLTHIWFSSYLFSCLSYCSHIRECLRLDPDHKECFTLYKKVKKLAKHFQAAYEARTSSQYEDCIRKADQILNTESKVAAFNLRAHSLHCHCFSKVSSTAVPVLHWTANLVNYCTYVSLDSKPG